jgi:hypothetical protein
MLLLDVAKLLDHTVFRMHDDEFPHMVPSITDLWQLNELHCMEKTRLFNGKMVCNV